LNPLRAGICKNLKELDRYPWCGHAVYMGYKHNTFQDTRDVLKRFGRNRLGAIKKYRDFLEAAIGQDQKDDLMDAIRKNNVDRVDRHDHRCWVIGDQEFVKTALAHEKAKRLQVALHSSKGLTIESVVEQVASQMKMDVSEVMIRGRKNKRSMLRKVSAALAHRAGGIPLVEIARYFGVGGSSISRMLDEGDGYAAENNVILKH
jgi:hypothetical protein